VDEIKDTVDVEEESAIPELDFFNTNKSKEDEVDLKKKKNTKKKIKKKKKKIKKKMLNLNKKWIFQRKAKYRNLD